VANYYVDFEGYTVGDDPAVDGPAEWTHRWYAPAAGEVEVESVAGLSPPSGFTKAMRLNYSGGQRFLTTLDAVDADADRATIKMAALVYAPNDGGSGLQSFVGVMARASGSLSTDEEAICGVLAKDGGDNTVYNIEYVASSGSVDSPSPSSDQWTADTFYWLVSEISGTTITTRLYPANDPGGTPIQTHVTNGVSAASVGWAGIFAFRPDNGGFPYILAFEAATGASSLNYGPPTAAAISFSGPVPDQSFVEDAAITPFGLSSYFSGSETPFSYAVTTGTLPAGLSLNSSTGVISGTPTTVGTQSIVVTATDANTDTAATNSFDITITAAPVVVNGVVIDLSESSPADTTGIVWAALDIATGALLENGVSGAIVSNTLTLDLDAAGGLSLSDEVLIAAIKVDGVNSNDSFGHLGIHTVEDIS
jgi:hypothetical protein